MNPEATPTPRTDKEKSPWFSMHGTTVFCVEHEFALQLERELTEKTNEVERLREENENLRGTLKSFVLVSPIEAERMEKMEQDYARIRPAPEWRDLGPDEMIQEGDEVQPKHHDPVNGLWCSVFAFEIGTTASHHNWARYRTRRPLPKQEEMPLEKMPLEKMLECFLADYPDAGKAIYDAIYNLRNEIEKLKNK